ncbi:putative phosphatidylserine decarboxylase [Daldinia sp. FL1419]|nr:putative phosphatidylserine decarboxylase [Daldinia sp. FL1419]
MSTSYHPLVRDLYDFAHRTDDRHQDFCQAIVSARNPDHGGKLEMDQEHIERLEGYFRFCDNLLKWVPRVDTTGDELLQKLLVFYWVFNQPQLSKYQTQITPESAGTDPTWLSYWQVLFARELGFFLGTKESACGISSFYQNENYNQEADLWQDPPKGGWVSFNQWFAREWKDIDVARPLQLEDMEDNVVVSAADSKFGGHFPVEQGGVVLQEKVLNIKGIVWPIEKLLEGVPKVENFNGGSFMHAFLSPSDYHRQHAPVSGTVVMAKVIQELVYLQVTPDRGEARLAPDRGLLVKKPLVNRMILTDIAAGSGKKLKDLLGDDGIATLDINAPDEPGYQWCQTRGLIVIETPDHGRVAVLPVGMAQVSSVVLLVEQGQQVEKGDQISYFQFGGSDIVLVFENPVDYSVELDHKCNIRTRIATFQSPSS